MEKQYLTFDEQVKRVNDKKITCDFGEDKTILIRIGYFNLVNGYKGPFTSSKDESGNHIYSKGTTIKEFLALKNFDDDLRYFLIKYITKVEEEVRTISSYFFDTSNNRGSAKWSSPKAYEKVGDTKRIQKMVARIKQEVEERKNLQYIDFYLNNHSYLPTWVITKVINFGTFIEFLLLAKPKVREALCKLYSLKVGGYNNEKLLIGSLHWMRVIRNSCAHNERIYCISGEGRIHDDLFRKFNGRYFKSRERRIMDLLVYMKYYLDPGDYAIFIERIKAMLLELQMKVSSFAFDNIRGGLGIKHFDDLDILVQAPFFKDYVHL